MSATDSPDLPAPLFRRLAAMSYDTLLLMAVWLVASALILLVNRGEPVTAGNPLMTMYFFTVTFLFFAWFWTHGGQTLGMKAWRLKLVQADGSQPGWRHALLRFLTALPAWCVTCVGILGMALPESAQARSWLNELLLLPASVVLGIGLLWVLYDNSRLSWRDKITHTRIIQLPKPSTGTS